MKLDDLLDEATGIKVTDASIHINDLIKVIKEHSAHGYDIVTATSEGFLFRKFKDPRHSQAWLDGRLNLT